MKVVRFEKKGGAVSIKVTVETDGGIQWKCVYTADGKQFHDTQGQPGVHALGMPAELEMDYNKWDFRLLNQSNKAQGYNVKIVWEQDGNQIDSWDEKGSIPAEDPAKLETDDCLLEGF